VRPSQYASVPCKWWLELPATQSFQPGGHCARRAMMQVFVFRYVCAATVEVTAHVGDAYVSLYSIRIPRYGWFSFMALKRPGDLDLWPFDLGTVAECQPLTGLFWCFCDFWLSSYWQTNIRLTTHCVDLWPLTSPRTSVWRTIVLHPCIKFKVRRSPPSADIAHFRLSINRPRDLDFWPFDGSSVSWASFLPILCLLCPSILNLGSGTG